MAGLMHFVTFSVSLVILMAAKVEKVRHGDDKQMQNGSFPDHSSAILITHPPCGTAAGERKLAPSNDCSTHVEGVFTEDATKEKCDETYVTAGSLDATGLLLFYQCNAELTDAENFSCVKKSYCSLPASSADSACGTWRAYSNECSTVSEGNAIHESDQEADDVHEQKCLDRYVAESHTTGTVLYKCGMAAVDPTNPSKGSSCVKTHTVCSVPAATS